MGQTLDTILLLLLSLLSPPVMMTGGTAGPQAQLHHEAATVTHGPASSRAGHPGRPLILDLHTGRTAFAFDAGGEAAARRL